MSRLLKALLVSGSAWLLVLLLCLIKHMWCFGSLWLSAGVYTVINFWLYKKLKQNVNQMNAGGTVRNVDYLIIGECIDERRILGNEKSFFSIMSPGRSLNASKEILRHTFSILKDGGTVIIVDKENLPEYSCFDMMWFHDITIKRLGLNKRICKFPLFYAPIKSIYILLQVKNTNRVIYEGDCPDHEIKEFCLLRGLNFKYYKLEKR